MGRDARREPLAPKPTVERDAVSDAARTLLGKSPPRPLPHEDVASIIAANLAPVAAMLFFGQSAAEILFLFALDTALSIYLLVWLVVEHVTEANSALGGVRRVASNALGALVAGSFLVAFFVGPLLFIALSEHVGTNIDFAAPGFRAALAMQVAGSAWALWRMHGELSARDDDDAYLSSRFKFVVARAVMMLFVLFSGFAFLFGPRIGATLLVLVYCGAGVWFGLFPDQAHRLFHPRKRGGTA